jgi:hypothetical protein
MRFFDNTDLRMLSVRIAAVEAQLAIADVITLRADPQLVFNVENGLREILSIFTRNAQQMKRNTLRGLLPDPGQPLAFLNQPR